MSDLEDEIYRREGEKMVAAHDRQIDLLDGQIKRLQDRRAEHERQRANAELQAKGIRPCTICNRHVPSPCNGWQSFHEDGPWDGFCREFLETRR